MDDLNFFQLHFVRRKSDQLKTDIQKNHLKILHVLYSGLGGHGNVFFSFVSINSEKEANYEVLFYGVEEVRKEYIIKCKSLSIPWTFVNKRRKIDFLFFFRIFKTILKSSADVLFLHSGTLILPVKIAALLSKKKKKIIVRETQANHLKTKWEWLYLWLSLKLADHIVFLTEEYKNEIKIHYPSLLSLVESRISVIGNGLDMETFKPAASKKIPETLSFGMQSRLVSIKDYPTLIKAYALYRKSTKEDSTLKIAGDGPERKYLEMLTKELRIEDSVVFMGMLNEVELLGFLNSVDIYVHATLGETMSTAIMQAMACELPIIASDVQGVRNMITDGINGFLVEPKNEYSLAKRMQLLSQDPLLRRTIAKRAYEKAKNEYSNIQMRDHYMAIIKKMRD